MSIRSPARTMAWSSTIRTRIFAMVLLPEGYAHVDRGSASGPRLERDFAFPHFFSCLQYNIEMTRSGFITV
jgi:hypothetical protein